jgi:uncharacterized membrane protein YeiH
MLLVAMENFGAPRPLAALVAATTVIVLRLLAIHYKWSLPRP